MLPYAFSSFALFAVAHASPATPRSVNAQCVGLVGAVDTVASFMLDAVFKNGTTLPLSLVSTTSLFSSYIGVRLDSKNNLPQ
jgi:hypothetical protein